MPLTGFVELNGARTVEGTLSFFPASGNSGPAAITTIVSGAYQFDAETGPGTGPYRVVIEVHSSSNDESPGETIAGPDIKFGATSPLPKSGSVSRWELDFAVPADGGSKNFSIGK